MSAGVAAARPRANRATRAWGRHGGFLLLLAPVVVFLVAAFVVPVVSILLESVHGVDQFNNTTSEITLDQYERILTTPFYTRSLWSSFVLSIAVVGFCLALGYPAAHALVNTRSKGLRAVMYAVIISPLLTSVIVRTYGWLVVFSAEGPVNDAITGIGLSDDPVRILYTWPASLIAVSHILIPFMILPLASAMAAQNPDLAKASSVLGAGPLRTWIKITMPLLLPGIVTGALLVFTVSMGLYVTPLLIGGTNQSLAAIRVYMDALQLGNLPISAALSFALLAVTALFVAVVNIAFRRWEKRAIG